VIVNPRAGRGISAPRWAAMAPALARVLGELDSAFTTAPGDAAAIARREAAAGRRLIIAFGGDGTLSEAGDGILAAGGAAELGLIPRGTGGDFRRMLQLPLDPIEAAQRIRDGRSRLIDAGRARYVAHDGRPAVRHFVNVASFGFSSAVASRANASPKPFGARTAFLGATLRSLVSYRNTDVWLATDGNARLRRRVLLVAAGNGCYFGAGMKICPDARLDDGALDVIVIVDFSRLEVLREVRRLYDGSHLRLEKLSSLRARRLEAAPVDPAAVIPLELDGETPGRLPATFEILPGALRVRA
jgi:YegS/Rv2252/BmrU family lipid kinase